MQKFTLEILLKIIGISSASGLIYNDNFLYIVSDNSTFLYHYNLAESKTSKIKLFDNSQENLKKKDKSDFESVLQKDKKLYLFGSGSKPRRQKLAIYDPKSGKATETDLAAIYDAFRKVAQLPKDELNIEGVVYYDSQWIFFQRGNGKLGINGIFVLKNKKLLANESITFIPINLPNLKHIPATFTDAVLVKDKIYFLAAAEDSNSTYKDGELIESIVGCLDAKKLKVDFTKKITETQKFEGLTLYKNTKDSIEFLLCEDNDTEALESTVYKLVLQK